MTATCVATTIIMQISVGLKEKFLTIIYTVSTLFHRTAYSLQYNVVRGFLVPRTVLENLDETTSSPLESSQATDLSSGSQSMCTSQLDPEHEEDILPVLKVPKLKHHDPLDDSIFNKRLGESI